MGFARKGVWVMGYCGPMGYGVHFPAHQVGGWPGLWVKRGYGLPEVWVKRGSTVLKNFTYYITFVLPSYNFFPRLHWNFQYISKNPN